MRRAVFTYAVLVMLTVALVCPPARAACLAGAGNGAGVCKITGLKECSHHRTCHIKEQARSHAAKTHSGKSIYKCSGSENNVVNAAFFGGPVFLKASGAWPLHIPNGVFSPGPEPVSYKKAAFPRLERPPEQ